MKKWNGLDYAITGTTNLWIGNERVEVLVYDSQKMIELLVVRDQMSVDEAVEFIDFNIENAYIGKDTPVLVWEYHDEDKICLSGNREDKIKELKEELEREKESIYDKDYVGNRHIRLTKYIELLELGCDVEDHICGLLVNKKFIVGVGKSKWCVEGKYKWYPYTDLPTFVKKYVEEK